MTVRFPFEDDAEYEAACRLAAERQQIAHEATYLQTWDELTDKDREMGAVEALHYLRAGRRAGLFSSAEAVRDA